MMIQSVRLVPVLEGVFNSNKVLNNGNENVPNELRL